MPFKHSESVLDASLSLSGWHYPTQEDCRALGALRRLPGTCFGLAGRLGTLRIGAHHGALAWLLSDSAMFAAEARRLDGLLWDAQKKSLALPGSHKNAPVGLLTLNSYLDELKTLVLVEGMPDYYAALELAINSEHNFRVATMLGSACSIEFDPAFALGIASADLRGCRVLVIPHNDGPGVIAATKWSRQLYALEVAQVQIQRLPDKYKDLNDFVSADPDNAREILQWIQTPSQSPNPAQGNPGICR
jgi:hypothetical protein